MFAKPPILFKVTIKSLDVEKLCSFYIELGISFTKINEEANTNFLYKNDNVIYELELVEKEKDCTKNLKISFELVDIEGYIEILEDIGAIIIKRTKNSVTVEDPDGNVVELIENISS